MSDRQAHPLEVHLGGLDPDAVGVELDADATDGGDRVRQSMARGPRLEGSGGGYTCHAAVPGSRPAGDHTPRLVPRHPAAAIPLEAGEILWQR